MNRKKRKEGGRIEGGKCGYLLRTVSGIYTIIYLCISNKFLRRYIEKRIEHTSVKYEMKNMNSIEKKMETKETS